MNLKYLYLIFITSACGVGGGPSLTGGGAVTIGDAIGGGPGEVVTTPLTLTDYQAANVVVGQVNFTDALSSPTTAHSLNGPIGNPIIIGSKMFFPDTNDSRLLAYDLTALKMGAAPNVGVGDGSPIAFDLTVNSQTNHFPRSLARSPAGGLIGIANDGDDSVGFLGWDTIPTATTANANFYLPSAQTCTGSASSIQPEDIFIINGKMLVSDGVCNRVLVWNSVPSGNGHNPDYVIGQNDFTGSASGSDTTTANYFNHPAGIWTNGTILLVADRDNNRILGWSTFPAKDANLPTSSIRPDFVIGQGDMSGISAATTRKGLSGPTYLTVMNGQLVVSDTGNNRVLIWDALPTVTTASNNPAGAPDHVLGQPGFTTGVINADANGVASTPTATSLNGPAGVYVYQKSLIITDTNNSRFLIYPTP